MRSLFVLLVIAFLMTACGTVTIGFGQPTPTATVTPTSTVDVQATATARAAATATAQIVATATAQAAATATAQAQRTATAQAAATATAQAQATATAQTQATATARAQATTTAQAGATATIQAFVAALDAMVQSAPGKPYVSVDGQVKGEIGPYYTAFDPYLDLRNFDAQVQLFNPADGEIHPWDYGFIFRSVNPNEYRVIVNSKAQWVLSLIDQNIAAAVSGKTVASGTLKNFDVSLTGSNTLRLFVRDTSAFLFVNGEYITSLNVSERNAFGSFRIVTGFMRGSNFPGLVLHYKNLNIKTLQ